MTKLLIILVAVLLVVDAITLTALRNQREKPPAPGAPDLAPRVEQLEKDLTQAQQDIGELKQEVLLLNRRGQPPD